MSLVGTRLGPYVIEGSLGSGGMGKVYQARDTKLNRAVALKVLPAALAREPERLARFQREAHILASLNHPNIGAIYGLEDGNGGPALVLELVEGPTLADRICRGPVPIDEALPIARQIAEALEAAHRRGVIHRDLKPANVKIRPDGTVKVLDFGLAKALETQSDESDSAKAETVTSQMWHGAHDNELATTRPGAILGTAAYMSPEQATGVTSDGRTDIWAFGVVLYEMLAARRAFQGANLSDTIAAVLKSEPDWSRLPPDTSDDIRRLLRRCLRKDRAQRLHDIADVRLEIDEARTGAATVGASTTPRRQERQLLLAALALAALGVVVQSARLWQRPHAAPPEPERRLDISVPVASPVALGLGTHPESLAISPDGLTVVYSALSDGQPLLWLRALQSTSAHPLRGTAGALQPFWSPDSRSVGFFAGGELKRIDVDGSAIRTLARAPFGLGGAWGRDGTILFAPLFSGPLLSVSADGGDSKVVTRLTEGQRGHSRPRWLSDGRHYIYHAVGNADVSGVHVGAAGEAVGRRLLEADVADFHQASSRLLFVQQGLLLSQRFDSTTLAVMGKPTPIAEQVTDISAAAAGPIVYVQSTSPAPRQFTWFDRAGNAVARVGPPDANTHVGGDLDASPDGRYVAVTRTVDGNRDVWFLDISRGLLSRFTTETAVETAARWSPAGDRVIFCSNRNGVYDLYVKEAGGGATESLLLSTGLNISAADWSSDGRFLLFRSVDPETSHDLWAMAFDGDRTPFPVVRTRFVEPHGRFSPDVKWLAFQSDESGRPEVYVQPFPNAGGRMRISTSGGSQIWWRADGRELFYLALDGRVMAVPMRSGPDGTRLEPGEPVPLFAAPVGEVIPFQDQSGYALAYVVSRDGQRFLVNTLTEKPPDARVTVILHWQPDRAAGITR